jgi:hypothetical protein
MAVIVFSKHCRMCEASSKKNKPVKNQRCPKNFDMKKSTKSMEGIGSIEHCKNVFSRLGNGCRAYIRQIVTDDDSTTRANLRHGIKDRLDAQYGDGGWIKAKTGPEWMASSKAPL